MRDHAVIDLKAEQRDGDSEDIGKKRPQRDLGKGAALIPKRTPEPMGAVCGGGVALFELAQRGPGAHNLAAEIGGELIERHFGALIGASLVIDEEPLALLPDHEHHLPVGHLCKGGPLARGQALDALDARRHTRDAQNGRNVIGLDFAHTIARDRRRDLADGEEHLFENIGGRHLRTQQARIGGGQLRTGFGAGPRLRTWRGLNGAIWLWQHAIGSPAHAGCIDVERDHTVPHRPLHLVKYGYRPPISRVRALFPA